jgi:molecular chaperone DnaK
VFTKLVERNTTIPTERKNVFSTAADNQTAVTVRVFQGERTMANDNRLLGEFNLEGIPPAPRGVPQIEVTFDIDANGILSVSAKDLATAKSQAITITSSSGLGKDEVEKMVKEAQSHADEDKQKRELVDARNQADSLAYGVEKLLKDNSDKLPEGDSKPIGEAIAELRKIAEGGDARAIRNATERLQGLSHKLAETLYKKTATAPPAAPPEGGKPADGNVVDAEYTVKN